MAMNKNNGFLLIEALLAMLVLSVAFVACLGATAQVLKFSSVAEDTTKAVLGFEELFSEIETGSRSDLIAFGGSQKHESYVFDIESQKANSNALESSFYQFKGRAEGKSGREYLEVLAYLPERGLG